MARGGRDGLSQFRAWMREGSSGRFHRRAFPNPASAFAIFRFAFPPKSSLAVSQVGAGWRPARSGSGVERQWALPNWSIDPRCNETSRKDSEKKPKSCACRARTHDLENAGGVCRTGNPVLQAITVPFRRPASIAPNAGALHCPPSAKSASPVPDLLRKEIRSWARRESEEGRGSLLSEHGRMMLRMENRDSNSRKESK